MIEVHEVSVIDAPVHRCFDLARSLEVHLLDNSHWGEATVILDGPTSGLVDIGHKVTWRARHLGIRQSFTTCITALNKPLFFQDTMLRGALQSLQHDHFFRPLRGDRTEMTDVLRATAPLPVVGRVAELLVVRPYMRRLVLDRSIVTKRVAESAEWKRYLSPA